MRTFPSSVITSSILAAIPIAAQTYSSCNPLTSGSCPPDTALGKSVSIDFTSGPSDSFTPQGNPTYDSNGASFTIAQSGDSPQLTSKWYLMFGHVDFVVQPAPGVGVVSSAVMQSDDLDEIDWEWLGGDNSQVQSNYFSKGQTTTYNRGAFHANPDNQAGFHTYSIDWTANQIAWQIDGTTVRTLTPDSAQGQYPQTPMALKIGAWSGGDSSNAPGTIAWAGGPTDYSAGPFSMHIKSISATDYSTGTQYTYSGTSGTWDSITAVGGSVNSSGGKGAAPVQPSPPAISSASNSAPMPFEGTHRDTSTYATPDIYPWVPTTLQKSTTPVATTYPGLPSGWTVRSDGKPTPPVGSPTPSPVPSPQPSVSAAAGGGLDVVTTYNEQGFPVITTQPAALVTAAKHFDDKGFLITATPALTAISSPTAVLAAGETAKISIVAKANSGSSSSSGARYSKGTRRVLGAVCGLFVAVLAIR